MGVSACRSECIAGVSACGSAGVALQQTDELSRLWMDGWMDIHFSQKLIIFGQESRKAWI